MKALSEMNRKEWKAYKKKMEKVNELYEKNPDEFSIEEINRITEYFNESARRIDIQTKRIQKAAFVFAGLSTVLILVSLILSFLKIFT